jgi:hypothetical protein
MWVTQYVGEVPYDQAVTGTVSMNKMEWDPSMYMWRRAYTTMANRMLDTPHNTATKLMALFNTRHR